MNVHRAKLFWLPGQEDGAGVYQIRCLDCGAVLVSNVIEQEFEVMGNCNPPDILGVKINERISAKEQLR